jgi:hypothetical protein
MIDFAPILDLAVLRANEDPRIASDVAGLPSNVRAAINFYRDTKPGQRLELYFDADTLNGTLRAARRHKQSVPSDDEVYDLITSVVTDAVQAALTEYQNGRLFAALIVENLRNGRDATRTDDQI